MSDFKLYQKTGLFEMRYYVEGEDLTGITVAEDMNPNEDMGMIARDPQNHSDQWYVRKAYFDANLEPVKLAGIVTGNGTFGEAVIAMQNGTPVARAGWNGKGLFIFMQVPADIGMSIVPKMQSLPDAVKDAFTARYTAVTGDKTLVHESHEHMSIRYRNQFGMVYPDNTIYGWSPSPSDCVANDWCIVQ